MTRDWILITVLLVSITADGGEGTPILVEPNNRNTFSTEEDLLAGTRIDVRPELLDDGEMLRFHGCWEPCESVYQLWTWTFAENGGDLAPTIEVERDGDYYFWLQQTRSPQYQSVVKIVSVEEGHGEYIVTFESGSRVRLVIRPPDAEQDG